MRIHRQRKLGQAFVLVAVGLWLTGEAQAKTINVPTPYATIQAAIDVAVDGDVVLVGLGRYRENIDFKGKAITVQSTNPKDKAVVAATIIDGQGKESVVLFQSGEKANSVLSGFTIANGNSGRVRNWGGGGVACYSSSPTVTHNIIRRNWAEAWGGGVYCSASSLILTNNTIIGNATGSGGGVCCDSGSTATLTNNLISGNTADGGGGVWIRASSPTLKHNTISDNTAISGNAGRGGGVSCDSGSAILTNNTITGNSSDGGAGVYDDGGAILTNNIISGNTAAWTGGGVLCDYYSSTTLTGNTIAGNSAPNAGGGDEGSGGGCGGGVLCYGGTQTFTNNIISDNTAAVGGGGVYSWGSVGAMTGNTISGNSAYGHVSEQGGGGGFFNRGSSHALDNNIVSGNSTSGRGGGIYALCGSVTMNNNTLVGNSSTMGGGGVCCVGVGLTLKNSIVAFSTQGGGLRVDAIAPPGTPGGYGSAVLVAYCDLYGNVGGDDLAHPDVTVGSGNLAIDPLFAEAAKDDYSLKSAVGRWNGTAWVKDAVTSPCIDAGDPASVYAKEPAPNGLRINMGYDGNTTHASKSLTRLVRATFVDRTHLNLLFSEPLDAPSAEIPGHYAITVAASGSGTASKWMDPILETQARSAAGHKGWSATVPSVTAATLDAGGKMVHLTTTPQFGKTTYTITANGVKNTSGMAVIASSASWTTRVLAPTPPTAVSITPGSPETDDDLVATASGSTTVEGTTPTYAYEWAKLAVGSGAWGAWGSSGATLDRSETTKGDRWKVRAQAYDGVEYSAWVESAPVTIANTAPTQPTAVIITPTSPLTNDKLLAAASGSTDADGATPTYVYQWARSTDGGVLWSDWGWPGAGLNRTNTKRDEMWKARARAYDGTSRGPWTESAPVTIGDAAPTAPTRVRIELGAAAGQLVASMRGSFDADGDAITYQFLWRRWMPEPRLAWTHWSSMGVSPLSGVRVGQKWQLQARAQSGSPALSSAWVRSAAFTVPAGSPEEEVVAAVTAPVGLIISAAACETRTGGVQLSVNLSSAASVEVTITNIAGRAVAALPTSDLPEGVSTLLWSGKSATGLRVPAGTYLARLTARSEDGSQCQALATVIVRR